MGMARRAVDKCVVATDDAEDLQFMEAGRRQPEIRLVARPALRTYEGTRRPHQRAGACPGSRHQRVSPPGRSARPRHGGRQRPASSREQGRVSLRLPSLRALLRDHRRVDAAVLARPELPRFSPKVRIGCLLIGACSELTPCSIERWLPAVIRPSRRCHRLSARRRPTRQEPRRAAGGVASHRNRAAILIASRGC